METYPTHRRAVLALLAGGTALSAVPPETRAASTSVPRWQPHDFAFRSSATPDNPFEVVFSAEVTGPDGRRMSVPGFYDGDGTWKLRVSANAIGAWSLRTRSDDPALDGQTAVFTCAGNSNGALHGALRVDRDHPSQFIFEDGAHYWPMGYECDWLWALDMGDPKLPVVNAFLDKIAAYGFNFVILNAFAYDTKWRNGKTGPDDFGPPPMFPWEGSNDAPDHSRFNLTYWRHYDRVMDALHRRGIVAHMLVRVYNKYVNWPENGSPEDDLYYRWLIARYAAYPNLTWDLAKEAQYEKDVDYKLDRLKYIRANDPYRRLLTVHDDREVYDRGTYDTLVDYRSDQQHIDWRQVMLRHLGQRPWPVINTEFGYECGPKGVDDKTYGKAQLPEEVGRRAWEVYMAGGSGCYYYTYTAWDVLRPADNPPGYVYFRRLYDFFARTAYWRLKPVDDMASDGWCLAEPGREYVVFLNAAKRFTLKLDGVKKRLKAEWYHPYTGERLSAGVLGGGMQTLTPPPAWGSGPVALHVV